VNHADGSNIVKIRWSRRIDELIALSQYDKHSIVLLHIIDKSYGTLTSDSQRDDGVWENDRITDRQDGKLVGNGLYPLIKFFGAFESPFHSFSPKFRMLLIRIVHELLYRVIHLPPQLSQNWYNSEPVRRFRLCSSQVSLTD
jgi:hypothetical protein